MSSQLCIHFHEEFWIRLESIINNELAMDLACGGVDHNRVIEDRVGLSRNLWRSAAVIHLTMSVVRVAQYDTAIQEMVHTI